MWSILPVKFFALFILLKTIVTAAHFPAEEETILFVGGNLTKIEEQLQSPGLINKNRTGGHLIIEGPSNAKHSKNGFNLDNALLMALGEVQKKRNFTSLSLKNVLFIRKLEHELNVENLMISCTAKNWNVLRVLDRIQLGEITKHFTISLPGVETLDVKTPKFQFKQLETLTTDFAFNLDQNFVDLFKQIQSLKTVKWDRVKNGVREIDVLTAVTNGDEKQVILERQSAQLYGDSEHLTKPGRSVASPRVASSESQSGNLINGVGSPQIMQKRILLNATESNQPIATENFSCSDTYSPPQSTLTINVPSCSAKDDSLGPSNSAKTGPVVFHYQLMYPVLRFFFSIGASFLLPIAIAFWVYRTAPDSDFD